MSFANPTVTLSMTDTMKSAPTEEVMLQLHGLCQEALSATERLLSVANYSEWNYVLRDNLKNADYKTQFYKPQLYIFAVSFTEAMKTFYEHVRNSPVTDELEDHMSACWRATCTALEQSGLKIPLASEELAPQDCQFGKYDFEQLIATLDWHIAVVRCLRDRYIENLQALTSYRFAVSSDAYSEVNMKIEDALNEAAEQALLPASVEAFWAATKVYLDVTKANGELTPKLGTSFTATLRIVIEVAKAANLTIPQELLEHVEAIDKAYASLTGI